MPVSLKKGQGVSLKKIENDLSTVTVGLGWDIADQHQSVYEKLTGKKRVTAADYDLDVIAVLCGETGKIQDRGMNGDLVGSDVIFYNNMRHKSGKIWLTGDNRDGSGDGDDEQIIVRLNELPNLYKKIVFIVQIYQGKANEQSFGQVKNAFIRAVDAKGVEMVRFDLSGRGEYSTARSLNFAQLIRTGADWHFEAIGDSSEDDSFVYWLKKYYW